MVLLILEKLRWPFRKLLLRKKGLVLYLGTDIIQPPRADIVLVPYNEPIIPFYESCKISKKIFLHCNCSNIPLDDDNVDFIILSSALEFCLKPTELLLELSRIGKAGYVESASALLDRFYPHPARVIEVLQKDKVLFLKDKTTEIQDKYLSNVNLFKTNNNWISILKYFPHIFFVTYNWDTKIEFKYYKNQYPESNLPKEMWSKHMIASNRMFFQKNSIKQFIAEKLNLFFVKNRSRRLQRLTELKKINLE